MNAKFRNISDKEHAMKFNFLLIIQIVSSLILSIPAFAEIKTVTHTLKQPFGGSQSPDDARIAGIARAKREALEQFGTYIESMLSM